MTIAEKNILYKRWLKKKKTKTSKNFEIVGQMRDKVTRKGQTIYSLLYLNTLKCSIVNA